MAKRVSPRSNDEWLRALRSNDPESHRALEDLREFLSGMIGRVLGGRGGDLDLGDLVQDTVVRLIQNAHTFRGDSAFTTWAATVATRVTFTALRKNDVRRRGHDAFQEIREQALRDHESHSGEKAAEKQELLDALREIIEAELTDRQRIAILAELQGVPTIEISRQLGITQNALYKLTHDARKKIRTVLIRRGFAVDAMDDRARGRSL